MKIQFIFSILLTFFSSFAFAAPARLTLQGRLVKDDIAVSGPVTLTVSVMSPNNDLCYLYEETHSITFAPSDDGVFSVEIGAGTRSGNDMGFSLVNVFSNTGSAISGLTCTGNGGAATSYTPLSGHTRYVYLSFNTNVGTVVFNDPYVVQSVPYAMEAEKLAGKSASEFLQTSTDTTQSKLNDLMIPANYAELLDLLNGSSAKYMTSSNSSPAKLPVLSAPPSAPTAGQIWYEGGVLRYFDGTSSQVKSIGSYTGASAPSTTDGYGITNAVIKGGQAGALVIGSTDSNLMLNADNTTKMTILGNGNVGIGTTSPGYQLHLHKDSAAANWMQITGSTTGTGANDGFFFGISDSSTAQLWGDSNNAMKIQMVPGGVVSTTFLANGNVGIGTTNPLARLHVIGSSEGTSHVFEAPDGTNNSFNQILFKSAGTSKWGVGHYGDMNSSPNLRNDFYIYQYTDQNDAGVNKVHLSIDDNGKVGIGTTSPKSTLQVNGYVQLALVSGAPPGTDCDAADERGRMKIDNVAGTLYICADSGWVAK